MSGAAAGRWTSTASVLAPVGLAIALRAYALDWGSPHFFEEATPLRKAWDMWAWGPDRFDGHPGFFRYPTLTMYLHMAVQAVLYVVLRATGEIASAFDFRVLFHVDPVPFFVSGRVLSAAFGVGTVWMTARLGARLGGPVFAAVAGVLLAANAFHVDMSQLINVDGALAFFTVWALLRCVLLAERASNRNAVVAGLAIGLATSSKYTGALLAVPFVVAWWLGKPRGRRALSALALGGVAAAVAFALTSPHVLLDFPSAWSDISSEREHMAEGHFGLGSGPAWGAYADALANRLLGWPALAAAVAGLILAVTRKVRWAIIVASFVLVYVASVGSWAMKADHYLLPVVAPLLLVGAFAAGELARALGRRVPVLRAVSLPLVALVLLAPAALRLPEVYARALPDTRRQARDFLERTLPEGSFVAVEAHGPPLLERREILALKPRVRAAVERGLKRPVYAIKHLPVLQVDPEVSAPFYDLRLLRDADAIVVTGDVSERYQAEPRRFAKQVAFYRSLESQWRRAADFVPDGGPGSRITIWIPPEDRPPFPQRETVEGPVLVEPAAGGPGLEADFYFGLGLIYEYAGFRREAIIAYGFGLKSKRYRSGSYAALLIGAARCLLIDGDGERARQLLEAGVRAAPSPGDRAAVQAFFASVRAPGGEAP